MSTLTLIDELLREQQSLTAVERFSQKHVDADTPLHERYYRDLIPLSSPGVGEQYSFEVDLDACSGCKACVSACNHLNGLDPEESWRDIGLLVGERQGIATQQVVTTACHHCADPACANGCPTLAYEKDSASGVVRHLDDQCMGCRYCELKCPYQVPKYNVRLGIVRKCDMCQDRLAVGEAPACVQACPSEAIKIRIVAKNAPGPSRLLPGAFDSAYTRPTTTFLNLDEEANQRSADEDVRTPAHTHLPLVWMLVMVPISVGMTSSAWLTQLFGQVPKAEMIIVALILGFLGLGGSILHLGRPLQAWRAVLGWRRSWLSREIIAFNLWALALIGFVAVSLLELPRFTVIGSGAAAAILGVAGLFASIHVYADTQRPFWKFSSTAPRFLGTALGAGLLVSPAPFLAVLPLVLLIALEASILFEPGPDERKSSQLIRGPLRRITTLRALSAVVFFFSAVTLFAGIWGALVIFIISELAARTLFFKAVDEPKMPGGRGV